MSKFRINKLLKAYMSCSGRKLKEWTAQNKCLPLFSVSEILCFRPRWLMFSLSLSFLSTFVLLSDTIFLIEFGNLKVWKRKRVDFCNYGCRFPSTMRSRPQLTAIPYVAKKTSSEQCFSSCVHTMIVFQVYPPNKKVKYVTCLVDLRKFW